MSSKLCVLDVLLQKWEGKEYMKETKNKTKQQKHYVSQETKDIDITTVNSANQGGNNRSLSKRN